ncbi:MAG: glucosylceramidase [Chitinophagaceae bacterium]
MRYATILIVLLIWSLSFYGSCSKGGKEDGTATPTPPVAQPGANISYWTTSNDGAVLLEKGTSPLSFIALAPAQQTIDIDTTQTFQTIDGFGYTLTSGSATVINNLDPGAKAQLLKELFSRDGEGIGISYLRVSIGASDLSASVYTYDDVGLGDTDTSLSKFTLQPDRAHVIPLLKEILAINPAIKILGSPWTPPVWMKDNGKSVGGSLIQKYYAVYAQYFVKYIQQMKAEGIVIDAITPQNEPLHPGNNPSLLMVAADQATFIKTHLGPAFANAGIKTKIITYDHNCDRPDYPLAILADAGARQYVDGSAFHLYAGDISVLSQVHNAYPDKNVYFTEQYTASNSGGGCTTSFKRVSKPVL